MEKIPKFGKEAKKENIEYEDFSEDIEMLKEKYRDDKEILEKIDSLEVSLIKNDFVSKEEIMNKVRSILRDPITESFDVASDWEPTTRFAHLSEYSNIDKDLALHIFEDTGELPVLTHKCSHSHNTSYVGVSGRDLIYQSYTAWSNGRFWKPKSPEDLKDVSPETEKKFYDLFGKPEKEGSVIRNYYLNEELRSCPVLPEGYSLYDYHFYGTDFETDEVLDESVVYSDDGTPPEFVVKKLISKKQIKEKNSDSPEEYAHKEFGKMEFDKIVGPIDQNNLIEGPSTVYGKPLYKIGWTDSKQYFAFVDKFDSSKYILDYSYEIKNKISSENQEVFSKAFNDVVENGGVSHVNFERESLREKSGERLSAEIFRLSERMGDLPEDAITGMPYDTICAIYTIRDVDGKIKKTLRKFSPEGKLRIHDKNGDVFES